MVGKNIYQLFCIFENERYAFQFIINNSNYVNLLSLHLIPFLICIRNILSEMRIKMKANEAANILL